jgi:two-component system sensor histidine kinase CpxA
VLLCYALAKHLTAPVRNLEEAVQRFGSGNLSARVDSLRRDELGALSRAFDQMASRIQTLVSGQRRLLLDISHELRSPLTRLGIAVELARSQQDNEVALDRIQKEADRLNALIGEIVSVTRFETDPTLVRKSRVAVDELLARIVDIALSRPPRNRAASN